MESMESYAIFSQEWHYDPAMYTPKEWDFKAAANIAAAEIRNNYDKETGRLVKGVSVWHLGWQMIDMHRHGRLTYSVEFFENSTKETYAELQYIMAAMRNAWKELVSADA
ncbi:MAG: hypothetical protein ACPG7F_00550 [Aggregatilineales bacterium]